MSLSSNRKIRKLLGHSYLREQRIDEALEVYLGILRDDPQDADVLTLLGNLYDLSGAPRTAAALFTRALYVSPENGLANKFLALAVEQPASHWEESAPLQPDALRRLAARLTTGLGADQWQAIRQATEALENGHSASSGKDGSEPAENADRLMAALVESYVRKARAAGQSELAEALQSLQIKLSRRSGTE